MGYQISYVKYSRPFSEVVVHYHGLYAKTTTKGILVYTATVSSRAPNMLLHEIRHIAKYVFKLTRA